MAANDCQVPVPGRQIGSGTWAILGWGLDGGVDAPWAAAGVGQGAVLSGAVMPDGVGADELFADGDLHDLADDGDLDLAAPVLVAYPVVGAGEADVARRVDFAGDRRRCHRWRPPRGALSAPQGCGLLVGSVAAGVGGDEHAAVVQVYEPPIADDRDVLAGEPDRCVVAGTGEADEAGLTDPPRRGAGEDLDVGRRAGLDLEVLNVAG
jgi:hypothetical protein